VDAKMASRPRKEPVSELKAFDMIAQSKGGAGNRFVNVRDLGIKI
jgi:hypothetical protein